MAKNNGKNKTPIIITAFVLVVVILIAYIALAICRGTYNPTQWVSGNATDITKPDDTGNKPNTPDTPVQPDKPDKPNTPTGTEPENDELIIEEIKSNGISLLSMPIAHAAEYISTQRITVKVLPEQSTDKEYTVRFTWADSSTVWANENEVLDYINYSETNNAAEIDINMKERFSEKIIGRFALKSNPEIYAETIFGCYVKTEKFVLKTESGNALYSEGKDNDCLTLYDNPDDGKTHKVTVDTTARVPADWNVTNAKQRVVISEATTKGTTSRYEEASYYYTVERTETLQSAMRAAGIDGGNEYAYEEVNCYEITWENLFQTSEGATDLKPRNIFGNIDSLDKYSKLINCLKQSPYDLNITYYIVTENGTRYGVTFCVNILDSSLYIAADDIQAPPEIIL